MKSSNNKKNAFTIEDFEKGLMLAGYLTPHTEREIAELEALKKYDKNLAREKSRIYFKRAVLAAEIVNSLKEEITFGRVKFQKLVYLCEHACDMELQNRYAKFAAGPFDNNFMHSINQEFKKQKWFFISIDKSKGFNKPVYSSAPNIDRYKDYYWKYFDKQDDKIQKIIELFRHTKTREVELVATIYFCLLEIKQKNQLRNRKTLVENFYKFADSKKQFSEQEINKSLDWMKLHGVYPVL
ncbi:MAG: hypothetical protein CBB72_004935 [Muricauda sp. TMED12]|nr:MAG: hypothetical protein CBB72_004935 [Muricauda sp. TMED12]